MPTGGRRSADEHNECGEGFGYEAPFGGAYLRFDDDAGSSFVNNFRFGDAVLVVDGGDIIDLHLERRAPLFLRKSRVSCPARGVIRQAEEDSAMHAPERLKQLLRKRNAHFDMAGFVIQRFNAQKFAER